MTVFGTGGGVADPGFLGQGQNTFGGIGSGIIGDAVEGRIGGVVNVGIKAVDLAPVNYCVGQGVRIAGAVKVIVVGGDRA